MWGTANFHTNDRQRLPRRQALRRLVERDTQRWGQLIKAAGIEPE